MKTRKIPAAALCIVLAMSMTACGSETVTVTSPVTVSESVASENTISFSEEYSESEFSGMVTSVDGTTITVSIMGNEMMNSENGEAPEMPSENSEQGSSDTADVSAKPDGEAPSGEAPSKPDGEQSGEAPSGEAPSMPEGGQGGEAPSGEAPSKPDGESNGEAPSMPDGSEGGEAPSGEAPSKPDGDTSGEANGEAPSGEAPSGEAPEGDFGSSVTATMIINDESVLFDADGNNLTLSDITEGSFVTVTLEDGKIKSVTVSEGGMGSAPQGSASGVESYTAVTEYTSDGSYSNETYESTGSDENAVLVSSGDVTISDSTVTRTSSDSTGGDNSSFYGVGAALLCTDGTLTVSNTDITTDSNGGAGIFAYGSGVVTISDSTITTAKDTSGGIHVAGGGTLNASNLTVTTNGESSAAIRSDRGGGTMVVNGGTYTSNGIGSPAVYCTANITVSDATLTANGSEAVCIEGLNSLTLNNCTLTGNMSDNEQNDCTWNIIVYQSMSGDSEVGNGVFSMTDGKIIAGNGGMFYTTNTESTITLKNVDIEYASENDFFLKCTGNANQRGWGTTGSNGAQCVFTADTQEMEGDVIYDSISTLDFYMTNGSTLTGAFIDDESCAGDGGDGYCKVYIDSSSKWVVTEDSTVTSLCLAGSLVDESGKTVSVVGTDGTVYVEGTSSLTVTVESFTDTY